MMHRGFAVPVLVATLLVAACRRDPPPPPAPTGPSAEELERMRQDSIRAAMERAQQDSIARAQAEAERLAAARADAIASARRTLEEMVYFDYDMSEIRSDAESVLRQKVEVLRSSPQVQIRIEGHADERGSTEYNLALGSRRAESVKQFLTSFGVAENRLTTTSFGEERPLAMGNNETAWARNRRAEFVITQGANAINPPNTSRER